jgi:hypothetical protein
VQFDTLRQMALGLPETEERTAWGTPAFYVREKMFARQHEDGDHVAIKVDRGEREALVASDPDTFVITPHYQRHPWVLVKLARVDPAELRELLIEAWMLSAPKRLIQTNSDLFERHAARRRPTTRSRFTQ